jgi:signal transduction histidine kinase/CheY-like chemotaxis protein
MKTVLVVDDEPNVIRLCQRVLERAGFTVLATTSPGQALIHLSQQAIDLLLVDFKMPGLDGFELLNLARTHQPDLAIVLMSGYGTLDTAITALHQGVDALILKPFTSGNDLIENITRALEENQRKRDMVRLRALHPVFDITESLFSETDPTRLNQMIVRQICGYLEGHAGWFYLKVGAADTYRLASYYQEQGESIESGTITRLLNMALKQEKPLVYNISGPMDPEISELLASAGVSGVIGAIIKHKDMESCYFVGRGPGAAPFRDADVEMFLILARQAAAAQDNARLYADLRSYVVQIEKSQQAMIQAERMAAAGRLTASIAHEINNPLQSLNNCLHLAGRRELSADDRKRYLELAQSELDRLVVTVQRMLDFYRPGARDRKPTNINEVIQKVVMLVEPQLTKSHIAIQTSLSANLPPVIVVASQIQQVLLNLIINSLEAMPEGGKIRIQTNPYPPQPNLRVKSSIGGNFPSNGNEERGVEVIISDTGPGIPVDQRELIFEPFYSTKESGTGLGLAVSFGIISAHGGAISLCEQTDQGACFRIFLPEERIK